MNTFRRAFASLPKDPALAARRASTPLQVRIKQEKLRAERASAGTSHQEQLQKPPFAEIHEKRGRLRGIKRAKETDGSVTEKVVGERIYFPNIVFKMTRNNTPPGKPYNPYEATFRVPLSVTKTDVRSYLSAIYGVDCTYIRTDVYRPARRKRLIRRNMRNYETEVSYKRVVIGLVKPFYYPLALEDMDGKERFLRESALEENFNLSLSQKMEREVQVKSLHKVDPSSGWSKRNNNHFSRKHILREIWKRKEEREQRLREVVEGMAKLKIEGDIGQKSDGIVQL